MNSDASASDIISSSNGPTAGYDPLTKMLHGLRLDGLDYGRRHLRGSWAYSFPKVPHAYFHVVVGSPIWLQLDDDKWSELCPGDAILIPSGHAHVLASEPDACATPYPQWQCRPLSEDPYDPSMVERHGGCLLFYGSMRFSLDPTHPLFRTMPRVLHAASLLTTEPALLPLLDALANEMSSLRIGAAGMAARLADVLAVQIIRSWVEHGSAATDGWLAAARHHRICPVLAAIHIQPEEQWSLTTLAALAGMSRSSFAEMFATVVGETPARYLTEVRMHLARRWIAKEHMPIAEIAHRLRYNSEPSFSRAFKRVVGCPPSAFRTAHVS